VEVNTAEGSVSVARGAWVVEIRFDVIDQRLEPVMLKISPAPGRRVRPITTTAVRRMNVATLIAQARAELLRAGVGRARLDDDAARAEVERRLARSAGRLRLDADHWIEVARVYTQGRIVGAPTRAVEQAFGVSYRRAAKYVNRARELGLLTKAGKGRASGTVHLAETLAAAEVTGKLEERQKRRGDVTELVYTTKTTE